MEMQVVLLLMKLCVVVIILLFNGSAGYNISPSPASPAPLPDGSLVHSSTESAPMAQTSQGPMLSLPLSSAVLPPHMSAVPPQPSQEHSPSVLPSTPHRRAPDIKSPITVPLFPDPAVSPISAPPSKKRYIMPIAAPPKEAFNHLSPMNRSSSKGAYTFVSPAPHKATRPSNTSPAHFKPSPRPPARKWVHSPALSPAMSFRKRHYASKRASSPAPTPSYPFPSTSNHPGPSVSPVSPFPSSVSYGSPAPSPVSTVPSDQTKRPVLPPTKYSPSGSSTRKPRPVPALPPPPPNQDCTSVTCTEPLTNTLPGSPCGCVWPMKVVLRLSVALYTFFPLVSELAEEIAAGVFMKQSQVRIIGANADSQQLDKTIVLIDLVPLGEKFDNSTAFFTYEKFWHKQVVIKSFFFGDYDVLYVRYPGLPPSPPLPPSNITTIDEGPHSGHGNKARTIKPLGVDIRKKWKDRLGGSTIAIIVLSSFIVVGLCIVVVWLLLLKCHLPEVTPEGLVPSLTKLPGTAGSTMFGSGPSSASLSFGSSIATYTGSAKTFSAGEIERATDNFDASRILGEGGFGRVYRGILDDGAEVAVKVLKRDDHQGGREFFAEVEMLSRLHHRNLVKLIGICTEDHARCLVYELIPNGSVESHLHGVDKETAPLDWGARMKIALGAAQGLAYLHEDSSPRVIHRDFKSSNILLGHDFTPKVSDFGLARAALEAGNEQISTHVMGTFGYVAPEYAMTGLLLVKSDVYSYGVVLLELLTGRNPVDMSQPQGQENLVVWARPLLTTKEGLDMIIDPALASNYPFDSVAQVAAIASMCVQPEVSHRPFMGEVVQALKLVCNKFDETKEAGSEEDFSILHIDARSSTGSGQLYERSHAYYPMPDYESSLDVKWAPSVSDIFSTSARFGRQASGSFRRHSSSGPLRTGKNKKLWERVRGLYRGTMSEHGFSFRLWAGSH